MCYRCGVCDNVVQAGHKMARHVIYREAPASRMLRSGATVDAPSRKEVAKEVPVCRECLDDLSPRTREDGSVFQGVSFRVLVEEFRRERVNMGLGLVRPNLPLRKGTVVSRPSGARNGVAEMPPERLCDLCGKDARGGQSTVDGIICVACLRQAREARRSA